MLGKDNKVPFGYLRNMSLIIEPQPVKKTISIS